MKILIVGAGLIGKERITALKKISSNYSIEFDTTVVEFVADKIFRNL